MREIRVFTDFILGDDEIVDKRNKKKEVEDSKKNIEQLKIAKREFKKMFKEMK